MACVGCCSLAPVALVGDEVFSHMSPTKVDGLLLQHRLAREKAAKELVGVDVGLDIAVIIGVHVASGRTERHAEHSVFHWFDLPKTQAVGGVLFAGVSLILAQRILRSAEGEGVRPDPYSRHHRIFQVFQHRR